MTRIPFAEIHQTLAAILQNLGFSAGRADFCARLFTESTCDGVYTHGVARFPRFVAYIHSGLVQPQAEPTQVSHFGAIERWDGNRGPGNLNAWSSMARAIALARQHGIGFVALRNTNHWMRAGSYGLQAANAGLIGICWTNTLPNMPAWGGAEPCVGNNPIVFAIPRAKGHVVFDMATSQFSYGAIEGYKLRGEQLPVDGGFDIHGNLTRDPAAIEASLLPLPTGYWKGAGLAMVLDMIAAITSMGNATHNLTTDYMQESGISQVFLAVNPAALSPDPGATTTPDQLADDIVASLHRSRTFKPGEKLRYPGEKMLRIREENLALGIPVAPDLWAQIQTIAATAAEKGPNS